MSSSNYTRHLQHCPNHSLLSAGQMYGQTRAKDGLKDRNVLGQLCGAIHRHQPVYPQQTRTDSEEPERALRDDGLLSAVPEMTGMAQACGWCSMAKSFSPESWPHAAELSPRPEKRTIMVPTTSAQHWTDAMCGPFPAMQKAYCGLSSTTSCLCWIHVRL